MRFFLRPRLMHKSQILQRLVHTNYNNFQRSQIHRDNHLEQSLLNYSRANKHSTSMIENVIKMALEERRNDIALSYFLKLSGEEITLGGRYLFLIRGFDEWLDSAVNGNDVGLNPIVPLTSVKESIQNRPVDVKCIRTESTENTLVKVVSNVIGPESMEKTLKLT